MASNLFSTGRLALVGCVALLIGVAAPACSSSSSGRVIPGFHAACTGDADCTQFGLTCSTGVGCVECTSTTTNLCRVNEVCSDQGACALVQCLDPSVCPSGTTCDTAARRCVSTTSGTGGAGGISGTGGIGVGGFNATGGISAGGSATGGVGGATGPGPDYLVIGGWHGYVWDSVTIAGSTITPTSFATAPAGGPYCASGSVASDINFGGVGIIGWNINQPPGAGTDPPLDVVYPSGTGLTVNFTNNGTSQLRVQIQGLNGATDANDRWCYDISTSAYGPVTIPFSSFNTTCWDTTLGTYYAGQAISAAMLLVPGNDAVATSFNICLSGFSEN